MGASIDRTALPVDGGRILTDERLLFGRSSLFLR